MMSILALARFNPKQHAPQAHLEQQGVCMDLETATVIQCRKGPLPKTLVVHQQLGQVGVLYNLRYFSGESRFPCTRDIGRYSGE